jgi:hypothetical protein
MILSVEAGKAVNISPWNQVAGLEKVEKFGEIRVEKCRFEEIKATNFEKMQLIFA